MLYCVCFGGCCAFAGAQSRSTSSFPGKFNSKCKQKCNRFVYFMQIITYSIVSYYCVTKHHHHPQICVYCIKAFKWSKDAVHWRLPLSLCGRSIFCCVTLFLLKTCQQFTLPLSFFSNSPVSSGFTDWCEFFFIYMMILWIQWIPFIFRLCFCVLPILIFFLLVSWSLTSPFLRRYWNVKTI